ncbi:hypothetical protein AMAG_00635 [Allomyces macrogynus ATCC 38327]|uniref:Uncharacterized protein n=1 Tax=Allomyces macrogynus (strain ATCC 38327) TaxID=578462 RepID=A0A0L0RWF7_ALLM3|nr:hypothetical protein AMAG_00635 [Allomyces macrogynus ATCC 38327]|eukprot:KNE54678.1 hypothetical protein AMAG_00635 [Allomyces macrogynus ATCC 38327]
MTHESKPRHDSGASTRRDGSLAATTANGVLATSHLYRLFPLTYPAANLKSLLTTSNSGRVRLDIRVVAVNELGLHPRKTLPLRPVNLFAALRSGTAGLDVESGKGTVRVEIDVAKICGLLESLQAPDRELVFVQITTDFDDCLGVVIGPFGVNRSDEDVVDVFRRFVADRGDGVEDELLIREEWGFGIPGKVWDSAVIVGRALPHHLLRTNPSISTALDLSSGTGFLATVVSTTLPTCTVYRTDVPDALDLMHGNCAGRANIHVGSLWWGGPLHVDGQFAAPAPRPTCPVDLLVCSDVLYEAEFNHLWATIVGSVRPGGVVVFGYKSRGLTVAEEDAFFDRMATAFDIEEVMSLGIRFGVIVIVYRKRS